MNRFVLAALATALSTSIVMPAQAQESLTLKKIKDTGTITLGHRESSIPFSYYDDKQQVIGYSHELMLKAVEGIKNELKLAKVETRLMPVTSAKRASDWVVVGTAQSKEAYGCMVRKDDPVFKKVVDAALTKAMTSGDAEKIYAKWFMSPIPPKGLNLGMPLSDEMKELYKAPNDKAFE
jgi:ABC-type amino acid transport substrate-binding protein